MSKRNSEGESKEVLARLAAIEAVRAGDLTHDIPHIEEYRKYSPDQLDQCELRLWKSRGDLLQRKLHVMTALLKASIQTSDTEKTLMNYQRATTEEVTDQFHTAMFGDRIPVGNATVVECYENFLRKGVGKPAPSAEEVPRRTPGTVHHFFQAMFTAIVETLQSLPTMAKAMQDLRMGYEEALAPSKHIPAYHFRPENEAFATVASAPLIIALRRRSPPSAGNTSLIEDGWSDSVGYANAVLMHMLQEFGDDVSDEELMQYSAVALALTPDELTATRVFLAAADHNGFEHKQISICRPPLRLHDDTGCGPGAGFEMLVNAIAACATVECKPRRLLEEITLAYQGDLRLLRRLGMGGSSDTYAAADGTAIKVRHSERGASLLREGQLLLSLQRRAACRYVPTALSMAPGYLQMTPCGIPLRHLISSLFAHRKLRALAADPNAAGFRTVAKEAQSTRPVGLLYLGYLVLAQVSEALKLAHRPVGSDVAYVHADVRISNIVVALREGGRWVTAPEIIPDREEGAAAPLLNTAVLVDWGHSMMVGTATQQPPGCSQCAADEVLHSRGTGDGSWVPQPRHEWESLAYLYWSITHHVLGECPWAPSAGQELTTHREQLLSSATDPVLVSVRAMVQSARADSTDLLQHVDMDALRADYQAMLADPTIPFQLPNLLPTV